MQSNFSPRNIAANKVERVAPNALKDFRCGESVLRASRSTFDCIDPAKLLVWYGFYGAAQAAPFCFLGSQLRDSATFHLGPCS